MTKQKDQQVEIIEKNDSILGLIARVFWMLFGNVVLFLSITFVIQHKGSAFYATDVVFWCTAAAMIAIRYFDIKLWNGSTATGHRASMQDWNKYAIFLLIFTTIAWVTAHAINYLIINK